VPDLSGLKQMTPFFRIHAFRSAALQRVLKP